MIVCKFSWYRNMDGEQDKKSENPDSKSAGTSSGIPKECSSPKDIPSASGARNRNFIPVGSPVNMFPSLLSASPPSFVSMEQILKAAEDVSKSGFNMALAHEIAVNKDFKLQQSHQSDSLEKKISEMLHKAFWEILQEELTSDPPDYTQAMVLLKEIKEILLWLLLPHNSRLKNEINDVLDIDLIEQQTKQGTVDVLSYAQFIISTMARICAPLRDPKIQELRQLTEIIPLYRGILETLDLMKLDMVNFTISHIRPHIQQHSIEYESGKFKEILQSLSDLSPPIDGLRFTRLWLQEVYEEVVTELGTDVSNAVIMRKAYLKVLQWRKPENFPETLHLDHERFITLSDNLTVMILTATVILVTYSNVGPSIQGISEFKDTLKRHIQIILADAPQCKESKDLESKMEAVGLQVAKEVNSCLEQHGFSNLGKEKEDALVSSIKQIASDNHSVRQLIMKRIMEFLELALHSSTNLKIPPGLSSLQNELSTFAGQFLSLVKHNQAVFDDYYSDIINQCKAFK